MFPSLVSTDTNLNSYCNFIEYTCFADDEISFSEFDIDESDLQLQDIVKELNRRLDLYGDFVPFEVLKDRVKSLIKEKEKFFHYLYCLYFSIKGGTSSTSHTNVFEQITDNSLQGYFGTKLSLVTSIGQNSANLINTIDKIKDALLEKKGSYEDIAVQAKDGGIDVITYKPLDNRGNQVVCLTDATIGKNWKREKKVITKLNYWKEYIHFKLTPITCLSVVHIVDDYEFFSASKDNGLIFDRARIMRYYSGNPVLESTLINWLKSI